MSARTHTYTNAREAISGLSGFERKLLIRCAPFLRYHSSLGSDSCSHFSNAISHNSTLSCKYRRNDGTQRGTKNERTKSIYRHCSEKEKKEKRKRMKRKKTTHDRIHALKRCDMSTTAHHALYSGHIEQRMQQICIVPPPLLSYIYLLQIVQRKVLARLTQ